jgi:hypothetical protein
MFNLDSLALKDTFQLQLKHPVTDELLWADKDQTLPVAVMIYGTSSKQYRNALTAMQNRSLKRGKKPLTAEQMRDEGVSLLVACSDSALNFKYKGAEVDTPEAFDSLYKDPQFSWLKDQVDAALGDVANFLEA